MDRFATSQANGIRSAWRHYLLVGAVAGLVVFWRLGAITLEEHESKVALAARVMIQPELWLLEEPGYKVPPNTTFNHWMVPVNNGEPRLGKTPLPYWLASGASMAYRWLGGGGPAVNSWTVRLPSAVAAILCVWAALALGRRMFSPRAALLGALFLASCVGLQKWGRDGRPEMLLCMFVTAAMAAFYFALEAGGRRGRWAWMAAFWVLLGLANLAKQFVPLMVAWPLVAYLCWRQSASDSGPEAALRGLRIFAISAVAGVVLHFVVTAVPSLHWWRATSLSGDAGPYVTMAVALGLPLAWYFLRSRTWRAVFPLLPTALPGVVVTLTLFVPWLAYMGRVFPGYAEDVFSREVTDRAAGTGGWAVAGPWIYIASMATMTLPWLAFLPGAFATGLMRRFGDQRRGLVYLLLWCLGFVLLMSAAAAKREHYILPMLPAICLLMGHVADDVFFSHRWIRPNAARLLGLPYGLVGVVGAVVTLVMWKKSGLDARWMHMLIVSLLAAVPMTVAGVLMWRRRFKFVPALMVASILLVFLGYHQRGYLWDDRHTVADFARTAATIVPPGAPVYHWGDSQSKTVFYFGRDIPSVQSQLSRAVGRPPAKQAEAALFHKWLAADFDAAPWVFGYSKDAARLGPEGYRSALEMTSNEEKRLTFVLYHRTSSPVFAPATMPR